MNLNAGSLARPALTLLASACMGLGSQAAEIDTGNPDLKVRWDNTFRYSAAARVKSADPRIFAGGATGKYPTSAIRDINGDDGDRNFRSGLISSRIDLLSELDVTYKDFGFRVSGAAWYDDVYNRRNDNNSPATVNRVSPGAFNEFLPGTRDLHGRKAELLDAFFFGKYQLGEMPGSFRAGRYAQIWGESLFFGGNGIAGGMAPVDVVKLQSVPTSTAKETTMPVTQLGTQIQLRPNLTLGGYYQLEWRKSRFPGVGSYFSTTDIMFPGAENGLFGPFRVPHQADMKPSDKGQYGVQLKFSPEGMNTEFGLYALRFHDKSPRLHLSVAPPPAGRLFEAYHEGIRAYGASFSTNVGDAAVAGEMSMRDNVPLVSLAPSALAGFNNKDRTGYAVGKSLHANLNVFYTLPRAAFWDGGALLAEVAFNRRLSIDRNAAALDPNSSRDAWSLRAVFSPQMLNVAPALDMAIPIGIGFTPKGSRSSVVGGFGVEGGGDVSIGLNFTYQQVWDMRLNYVHYYGRPGPGTVNGSQTYLQALRDRNFVSLSLQRAF